MLYLERGQTQLLLKVGGSEYAIAQLQKASVEPEPSQDIEDCLNHLIEHGCGFYSSDSWNPASVELAIKWNSLALWEKAAKGCGFKADPLKFGWEKVVAAWDKFGFEALRPS